MPFYFKPYSKDRKPSDHKPWRGAFLRPKHVLTGTPKFRHLLKRKNIEVYSALAALPGAGERELVLRTLPRLASRSVPCLYRLAAECKTIDRSGAVFWQEVLKAWFFLAQPVNPKLRWPWVRKKFEAFYRSVKVLNLTARLDALAAAAFDAGRSTADNCKSILTALARKLGNTPYVSCRLMGKWLNVAPSTANRHLNALVEAGVIGVVEEGKPSPFDRTATTYDLSNLNPPKPLPDPPEPRRVFSPPPVCHRSRPDADADEAKGYREVLTSCVSRLTEAWELQGNRHTCMRCHQPACDCFDPVD